MNPATAPSFSADTDYPFDKVIYESTGSFALAAFPTTVTTNIAHNLPFIPLCNMSWSTTPDFSICYPAGSGPAPTDATRFNLGIDTEIYASSTNIVISSTNFLDIPVTIYYRIYGFEPSDGQNDLPFTASAADNYVVNTDQNYTKLYMTGKLDLTAGTTVTHNLGYIPQIEVWSEHPSSVTPSFPQRIIPVQLSDNNLDPVFITSTTAGFILTTTTLRYIAFGTPAPTFLHYRIYLDS